MKTIKIGLFLLLLIAQFKTYAQFNWAKIGVDGLTCSACTRSVEMSIRKLSFVDSVIMNLDNTEGKVIFKKGAKVEIEKISKAVIDAGFSLRSLEADITMDELKVNDNLCWTYENNTYHFIKIAAEKELKGEVLLRFIGEKYLSKKEFKNWKIYCKNPCNGAASQPIQHSQNYYVSLL
jgi:copper chaperone CopZ